MLVLNIFYFGMELFVLLSVATTIVLFPKLPHVGEKETNYLSD